MVIENCSLSGGFAGSTSTCAMAIMTGSGGVFWPSITTVGTDSITAAPRDFGHPPDRPDAHARGHGLKYSSASLTSTRRTTSRTRQLLRMMVGHTLHILQAQLLAGAREDRTHPARDHDRTLHLDRSLCGRLAPPVCAIVVWLCIPVGPPHTAAATTGANIWKRGSACAVSEDR